MPPSAGPNGSDGSWQDVTSTESQAEIVTTVAGALIAGCLPAGGALPDSVTARLAIDHAREIAPDIQMVVRRHGEDEQREVQDLELVLEGER